MKKVFTQTIATEIGGVCGPIERVNVPQQSNQGDCGMFVLKYIELLSAEILLDTCTSHNMPFFRLKLAAEILRGDAYMT
ncbi:unnamed protein product [Prunus armeniaca]